MSVTNLTRIVFSGNLQTGIKLRRKGGLTIQVVFFCFKQSIIRLLVAAGGNVDLQTGSYRGNVTALMLAAAQGHLELVKALVELKASPDKKGWFVRWLKFSFLFFTSCSCCVVIPS